MKRHVWLVFRLLVSAAALTWLFSDDTLRARLTELPIPACAGWLVVAWLVAGLGECAGLLRFWCCLHLAGVPLPLRRVAAMHFSGLFTSLFLPGMAGGDALKGSVLAVTFPHRRHGGLLAVLMDRLSGFMVVTAWLALMAWLRADWFAQNPVAATALRAVLWTAGPLAAMLLIWFLLSRTRLMRTRIRRFPFRAHIVRCEVGFDVFVTHPVRTLALFVTSFAGFAAYFLIFQCAALAYETPLIWRDTFSVMPLLDLITMLPVTVAGLGLREQTFQWIVAPLCGFPPALGVIVSLSGFLIGSSWALLGAPVFLWLRTTLTPTDSHA